MTDDKAPITCAENTPTQRLAPSEDFGLEIRQIRRFRLRYTRPMRLEHCLTPLTAPWERWLPVTRKPSLKWRRTREL